MVERKHTELREKINYIYDSNLKQAYEYVDGLVSIKETAQQIQNSEIKVDLEQITLNKAIGFRLREIETELDFEFSGQEMDLIESKFMNEPFSKIEKNLLNYDFLPIQQSQLNNLIKIFVGGNSKIIDKEMITSDFLTTIIPAKMKKAELIYQHTSEIEDIQKEQKQLELS